MSFWNGKKVLVTGGCGMVGHHLIPLLLDEGASVTVVTNVPSHSAYTEWADYYIADAGDECAMMEITKGMDAVFNLAASVSGIFYNLDNQAGQFWLNMQLQAVPLLVAARLKIPLFLQVSTVCAYDSDLDVLDEKDAYVGGPPTGYAWAKRMGEHLVQWSNYGGRAPIVRFANLYGEHDKFGVKAHVIPVFIERFLDDTSKSVILTGNGSQSREFLHAEDGALGLMAALEHGANGRIYNLGTNGETQVSIRTLAQKIRSLTGSNKTIVTDSSIPIIDRARHVVSTRASNELGWKYRIGLDEGLQRTITWYRNCTEYRE